MPNFTSWRKYAARAKVNDHPKFQLLSVANARFRVAVGLRHVEIDDLSNATADGYFQGLRVTLAYTATEALGVAIDDRRFQISAAALADNFRADKNAAIRNTLLNSLKSKDESTHARALRDFFNSDSEDLRPVTYAVRNLMAHGSYTVAGMGLTDSVIRRTLLKELADATLRSTDERFSRYVSRIEW